MRNKKRSKEYVLNRILFSQVIILCVLLLVLLVGKKEPVTKEEQLITPTIGIDPNLGASENHTVAQETDMKQMEDNTATQDTKVNQTEDNTATQGAGMNLNEDEANQTEEGTNQSGETSTLSSVPAFAQGMSNDFINSLSNTQEGTLLQKSGVRDLVYYSQSDARWAQLYYGDTDTIEEFGCGPTSLAIAISSMTETKIDPVQMCAWAYEKDYWFSKSGSKHNLIPEAVKAFGLQVEGVENSSDAERKLRTALEEGSMVIALMGSGSFTKSGHFIVFYGLNEDGLVYVADPASEENTNKTWELSQLVSEAKSWAAAGGPFWVIKN